MKVEKCGGVSVCVCASVRISGLCRPRKGSATVISRVVLAAGAKVQRNRSRTARHTSISPSGGKKEKKKNLNSQPWLAGFFSFFFVWSTKVSQLPRHGGGFSPSRVSNAGRMQNMAARHERGRFFDRPWVVWKQKLFPESIGGTPGGGDADLNASRQMGEEWCYEAGIKTERRGGRYTFAEFFMLPHEKHTQDLSVFFFFFPPYCRQCRFESGSRYICMADTNLCF